MDTNPHTARDRAAELQARVAPQIEQARQRLTGLNNQVVGFIRKNPGTCLLGALAVGYTVALMVEDVGGTP